MTMLMLMSSAGRRAAKPTWMERLPCAVSGGLLLSSQITWKESSGVFPRSAPVRHLLVRKDVTVARTVARSLSSFRSKAAQRVSLLIDSVRWLARRRTCR